MKTRLFLSKKDPGLNFKLKIYCTQYHLGSYTRKKGFCWELERSPIALRLTPSATLILNKQQRKCGDCTIHGLVRRASNFILGSSFLLDGDRRKKEMV
jgi:hypothetical protein